MNRLARTDNLRHNFSSASFRHISPALATILIVRYR
jgi:hypothetical protein